MVAIIVIDRAMVIAQVTGQGTRGTGRGIGRVGAQAMDFVLAIVRDWDGGLFIVLVDHIVPQDVTGGGPFITPLTFTQLQQFTITHPMRQFMFIRAPLGTRPQSVLSIFNQPFTPTVFMSKPHITPMKTIGRPQLI